jgi:beta-phosphoglucomutase-like phosphatase (HAD superfamily)
MPNKVSAVRPFVVVELVGPLIDDRGLLLGALGQVLAGTGVELRPGALGQVAGADLDWALRTLLEGHGRDDLIGRLADLQHRVLESWERLGGSQELRPAPGGEAAWATLVAAGDGPLVLTALPPELVDTLGGRFGYPGLADRLVRAQRGGSGLPRPGLLVSALEALAVQPARVVAGVASPAAVLGAVGARCGEVVQVGLPTGIGEAMPVDRFVGRIDELLTTA